MRVEYLNTAQTIITDPYILVNLISLRVKQLRQGSRPFVESLERLSYLDTALREIMEGKIGYELLGSHTLRYPANNLHRVEVENVAASRR
ncbi:DNA-directed RNA polymerase subunit omega [Pelagicoccus sp. SDUM812003]|uniref:DNA-directed RNA polymerase subunit omega n=1 Tax=Pelagicoccus sp. SDUM812003 TaxID=3041267 RepID=UPI00280D2F60|nr:DNA-directed RNA polymerase subunit omega [Pelagicoccus sp. SDUM812003]MDQ8204311.1 DNA-directed RNA polymerase subunit omega [Pelagicoccus sp. SDUM812003]